MSCHDQAAWKPARGFDHQKTAFPLTGEHQQVACASCHPKKAAPQPGDADGAFLQLRGIAHSTCASCHRDAHAGRMGPAVPAVPHDRRLARGRPRALRPRQDRLPVDRRAPEGGVRVVPQDAQRAGRHGLRPHGARALQRLPPRPARRPHGAAVPAVPHDGRLARRHGARRPRPRQDALPAARRASRGRLPELPSARAAAAARRLRALRELPPRPARRPARAHRRRRDDLRELPHRRRLLAVDLHRRGAPARVAAPGSAPRRALRRLPPDRFIRRAAGTRARAGAPTAAGAHAAVPVRLHRLSKLSWRPAPGRGGAFRRGERLHQLPPRRELAADRLRPRPHPLPARRCPRGDAVPELPRARAGKRRGARPAALPRRRRRLRLLPPQPASGCGSDTRAPGPRAARPPQAPPRRCRRAAPSATPRSAGRRCASTATAIRVSRSPARTASSRAAPAIARRWWPVAGSSPSRRYRRRAKAATAAAPRAADRGAA